MLDVRREAVAGTFYPDRPDQLKNQVDAYLQGNSDFSTKPVALIAPHAGYIYSGSTAGSAYRVLKKYHNQFKTVILLGPAHRVAVDGIAVSSASCFQTPLGQIKLNDQLRQELLEKNLVVEFDEAHRQEHSLEVHLPFLQSTLGEFMLIPLVVGHAYPDNVAAILNVIQSRDDILIVASTDLSHFHDYQTACQIDEKTAHKIEKLSQDPLHPEEACGAYVVNGLLTFAREHHLQIKRLDLKNSGDTAGSKDQVVGYGAWVLYKE